jgi:hypothetical protein
MLTISDDQRRARLVRRHHLAGATAASSVADATKAMMVLHASDPATVYLSALARCPSASVSDVSAALYDDRALVKMLGMRRTMFVMPVDFAAVVHSAAGLDVAGRLRRRLVQELRTVPTEPQLGPDVDTWLSDLEDSVDRVLLGQGEVLASELAKAEPRLRTAVLPTTGKKWDVKSNITSRVLTLMGADGRIVRGRPAGSWLSRQHRWSSARSLWPDGMPTIPVDEARAIVAHRWLEIFGPAPVHDIQWWTGWSLGVTRKVLAGLETLPVDLPSGPGVVLADDAEPDQPVEPSAVFLPALDSTPMGWQQRDWFVGSHREALFDTNGNIGPTVWWDGRIVGGWAMRAGEIVWRLLEDVGSEAIRAVADAAAMLHARLDAASVIPSFRTPLELELSSLSPSGD